MAHKQMLFRSAAREKILRRAAAMADAVRVTLGPKSKCVLNDPGKAKRVVVDKDNTTIIGGAGAKQAIEGRCSEIRQQLKEMTSDYDREKLEERLAKLAGGVADDTAAQPDNSRPGDQACGVGSHIRMQLSPTVWITKPGGITQRVARLNRRSAGARRLFTRKQTGARVVAPRLTELNHTDECSPMVTSPMMCAAASMKQ